MIFVRISTQSHSLHNISRVRDELMRCTEYISTSCATCRQIRT